LRILAVRFRQAVPDPTDVRAKLQEIPVRPYAGDNDSFTFKITGHVLSVCPTKIPMPGGATFVNEGLAEFKWDERTGYGIAEHWHAVALEKQA